MAAIAISNTDILIGRSIVLAQDASDSAKGLDVDWWISYKESTYHYRRKDGAILRAIRLICSKKSDMFHFYVVSDISGVARYLVYFNFN